MRRWSGLWLVGISLQYAVVSLVHVLTLLIAIGVASGLSFKTEQVIRL
jgi:hypothetical protein